MSAPPRKVLGRLSLPERTFVADALRTETVGGVLLLIAAVAALIWANVPALHSSYESVSHYHLGPRPSDSTCRSNTGPPTDSSRSSSSWPASSSSASWSPVT